MHNIIRISFQKYFWDFKYSITCVWCPNINNMQSFHIQGDNLAFALQNFCYNWFFLALLCLSSAVGHKVLQNCFTSYKYNGFAQRLLGSIFYFKPLCSLLCHILQIYSDCILWTSLQSLQFCFAVASLYGFTVETYKASHISFLIS